MMVDPRRTDLCIEAYPRSANSTAVRLFRIANPGAIIAHHTHTTANLSLAVRHDIPALVILRPPLDAICSSIIYAGHSRPDGEILHYVIFHEWVANHSDYLALADFATVLTDFNVPIGRINRRFGTTFSLLADVKAAMALAQSDIRDRYKSRANRTVTNMPLPSEERARMKETWREAVSQHPLFSEACAWYMVLHTRSSPVSIS